MSEHANKGYFASGAQRQGAGCQKLKLQFFDVSNTMKSRISIGDQARTAMQVEPAIESMP
jgi:hypothetical protein